MHKSQKKIILIVIVLLLVFIIPDYSFASTSLASNHDRTYTFNIQNGYYQFGHTLYISVPPSLYDYYVGKSHRLLRETDYSKFVTPDAFKSIAESIQNVTSDEPYSDEKFANAVLMLVHQISYAKGKVKYPVEAIVDSSGDCEALSLLAASIMKAGGLDVVLLYYKELTTPHINVGVYLPYTPVYHSWWMAPTYYEYNGTKYWMAECTPLFEWKVGDQPEIVAGAEPWIISLKNCEKSSPAEVASSLDNPLIHTSISINLTSENSSVGEKKHAFTISGSISPAYSMKRVVMYVSQDGSSWNTFRTVFSDDLGNYSLPWTPTSTGTYSIRTSLSDVSNYTGSDSEILTVFIRSAGGYINFLSRDVKEFFKSNLSGTGIFLSGDFIMLGSGQTTNSQFGVILRHNGGNDYSVSARVLDDSDISQITKRLDGNSTAFMDASMCTRENTWYKIAVKMSEDKITAELYDNNSTLLKSISTRDDAISIGEFGILLTYDADTVIAFKNLKVETLDQPTQPVAGNNIPVYYKLDWRRGG